MKSYTLMTPEEKMEFARSILGKKVFVVEKMEGATEGWAGRTGTILTVCPTVVAGGDTILADVKMTHPASFSLVVLVGLDPNNNTFHRIDSSADRPPVKA